MNKSNFIFLFLLFFAVFAGCTVVDDSILENFENSDSGIVRVVIYKNITNYVGPFLQTAEFVDDNLGLSDDQIKYNYDDRLIAFISREDLEQLQNNRDVYSIETEMVLYTFEDYLFNETYMQGAVDTWKTQVDGINITGAGQTVCIIDTGVNYYHTDLGGCYGNNSVDSNCKVIGGWDFCADDTNCSNEDWDPMDEEGHGTHVSGIVSANGTIKGMAPDSKIIMIKAANSSGVFWLDDIKSGIKWCIDNASKFNISVISMSLGSGSYRDYCDIEDNSTYNLIKEANEKNISVVVASGNDQSYTNISFPACLSNVVPVASIVIDNEVANYSNRNNLTKLVAYGSDVCSTWVSNETSNNTYECLSGTSMAAPMVSGAYALMHQYFNISGERKNATELEDIFYATGMKIYDSYSLLNFSRINVSAALLSFDSAPTVNESSFSVPNNTIIKNITEEIFLNFSYSDNFQLKNLTLEIVGLYENTTYYNITYYNVSGLENSTNYNAGYLSKGGYYWNIYLYDEAGNLFSNTYYFIVSDGVVIEQKNPENNTYTNINDTTFSCNATSFDSGELSNVTFFFYNSTNLSYSNFTNFSGTSVFSNFTEYNYTLPFEGTYYWSCFTVNNNSKNYTTNNYTIVYDITYPELTFIGNTTNSNSFNVSMEFNESVNVSLNLGNGTNITNSSRAELFNFSVFGLEDNMTYNYSLTYCDRAGNCNDSSVYVVKTDIDTYCGDGRCDSDESCSSCLVDCGKCPSSGGGSSLSSEIGTKTNPLQIKIGYIYSKTFEVGSIAYFKNSYNELHSVKLKKIYDRTIAEIIVSSNPIIFNLTVGETMKLNISNDEYYDLAVRLVSVGSATVLEIKEMWELIPRYDDTPEVQIPLENETKNDENYEDYEDYEDKSPYVNINLEQLLILIVFINAIVIIINVIVKIIKKLRIKRMRVLKNGKEK